MCQLAAYIGDRPIAPHLLEALKLQESYYGGQATGLGTLENGVINWIKEPGPVDLVVSNSDITGLTGTTGIAHSRLRTTDTPATHNRAKNAHPFTSTDNTLALMHNGIIGNYKEHWTELAKTYKFKSFNEDVNYITDSEVAVHLIDKKMFEGLDLENAIREAANELTKMVLLAVICIDEPETVFITNWIQACTLGVGSNETMFSSNPLGFKHVEKDFNIFTAPRNSFIKMTRSGFEISRLDYTRNAPATPIDMDWFKEVILEILTKFGELNTLEIHLKLEKPGGERIFNITYEEWKKLQELGWGDQNQFTDNLNTMSENGLIKKTLKKVLEGGVIVPRYFYSLP
jgi:glucosamine 6-phosphate synthetase-like amidotransferase/phosphosugar isomerase protein